MPCNNFEDYMSPMAAKRSNPDTFMRDAVEAQIMRHAEHERMEREFPSGLSSWSKRQSFDESALEPGLSNFESPREK